MQKLSKDLVKEFFNPKTSEHWDMHFNEIVKELDIPKKDIPKLREILDQLTNEGWVVKSPCGCDDGFEYDPGENYGVWG